MMYGTEFEQRCPEVLFARAPRHSGSRKSQPNGSNVGNRQNGMRNIAMSGGAFAAIGLIVWQPQGFDARERGQRTHGMHEQRCLEVCSVPGCS
jgi:hypothetical protein